MGKSTVRQRRSRSRFTEIPGSSSADTSTNEQRRTLLPWLFNPALRPNLQQALRTAAPIPDNEQQYDLDLRHQCTADVLPNAECVPGEAMFAEEPPCPVEDTECDAAFRLDKSVRMPSSTVQGEQIESRSSSAVPSSALCLKLSNWRIVWALLLTNGSRKLSKEQYQAIRTLTNAISDTGSESWLNSSRLISSISTEGAKSGFLPHFSTLHKTFKPLLLNVLAPRGLHVVVGIDLSKSGARCTSRTRSGDPQSSICVIRPSEYARADISTPPVWAELQSTSLLALQTTQGSDSAPPISSNDCIDISPIVAARHWFYGARKAIHVDFIEAEHSQTSFAEVGDDLCLFLFGKPALVEEFDRCFASECAEWHGTKLIGTVCHSWTVHHMSRVEEEEYRENYDYNVSLRDRQIASIFGFVDYCSPTDRVSVEVPDVPVREDAEPDTPIVDPSGSNRKKRKQMSPDIADAMRKRREALKLRKKQMEAAWATWKKPVVKPGDFVAMLRPCSTEAPGKMGTLLTETDRNARLCLVHRFWAENEERARHVFWIRGGDDLEGHATSLLSRDRGDLWARCDSRGIGGDSTREETRDFRGDSTLEKSHDLGCDSTHDFCRNSGGGSTLDEAHALGADAACTTRGTGGGSTLARTRCLGSNYACASRGAGGGSTLERTRRLGSHSARNSTRDNEFCSTLDDAHGLGGDLAHNLSPGHGGGSTLDHNRDLDGDAARNLAHRREQSSTTGHGICNRGDDSTQNGTSYFGGGCTAEETRDRSGGSTRPATQSVSCLPAHRGTCEMGDKYHLQSGDPPLWLHCSAPVLSSSQLHLDVRAVHLHVEHNGRRGWQKYRPISSVGVLDDGQPYFIYRFILFWDGFNVQSGKHASGEGVYLLPLNLSPQARSSPSAVRILSLTPPGVKSSTVLECILQDILKGMTEGYTDFDADGIQRRIFLDMVGCVGDTPALNAALDVLGHTAASFCHLCRYVRRASTLIGSRYTALSSHGLHSVFARGFFQHSAVRDSGAKAETCRLLGIKYVPNLSSLPLHAFRAAFRAARTSIPTTAGGSPVVPSELDPYRACFIAPDHLLSGHFRDCVSLVFKLLPNRDYVQACESAMLSLLAESRLPVQTHLVDYGKRSLYTMSMTELYSLAMVAELSFVRGCAAPKNAFPIIDKCKAAISVVGSCANLIAEFWRRPEKHRDGPHAVRLHQRAQGRTNLRHLQQAVDAHIKRVQDICTMSDVEVLALEDPTIPHSRKIELSKTHRACLIAIKTIDKPNIHRLRELPYTTLEMVGHVSAVGELVLEKRHQSLKRALKQSNNKDAHLLAMRSIAIDDWQGRLTAVVPGLIRLEKSALTACFRFLSGREALASTAGKITSQQEKDVLNAMGPNMVLAAELESQKKSVLSPRTAMGGDVTWASRGALLKLDMSNSVPLPPYELLISSLKRAFRKDILRYEVYVGSTVSSTLPNGTPGLLFNRGDFVQTLCCRPADYTFHIPFVVQTNCSSNFEDLCKDSGLAVWYITDILQLKEESGEMHYFVAVLPCTKVGVPSTQANLQFRIDRFKVIHRDQVSFAKLDISMRRIGVIRDGDDDRCLSGNPNGSPSCPSNLNRQPFYALTREVGFPPRKG